MEKYCIFCMEKTEGQDLCPHCGKPQKQEEIPAHQLLPGTLLGGGRYLIGRAIGQGGFGITYVGRDLKLDLKVAVKEYYPSGYANRNAERTSAVTFTDRQNREFMEAGKKKFLQEARELAQFHDMAGVVDVRDYFEENETAYIVMEFLDGQDLRRRLKEKLFSADEIFGLLGPLFNDLEEIHKVGVIHRDISPDNLMLLKNGSLKLMDFGAARVVNVEDERSVSVVLKSGYAPREQYRPRGRLGPWTDVYALCATVYQCITGITPPNALEREDEDTLRWPSALGFAISDRQETVLKKGLEPDEKLRLRDIGELKALLYGKQGGFQSEDGTLGDDDDRTVRWEHKPHGPEEKKNDEPAGAVPSDGAGGKPEEPSKENGSDNVEKANRKRRGLYPAGLAVAAAAVVCAAVTLTGKMGGFGEGAGEISVQTESTADTKENGTAISGAQETGKNSESMAVSGAELKERGIYHIRLTPGVDTSAADFKKSVELLTGRLDVFAGENGYELLTDMGSADLYVPKSAFQGVDVSRVLQSYLTRQIRLYAYQYGHTGSGDPCFEIRREDIESVTVEHGTVDGFDAVSEGYAADAEYSYLRLTLTDACAEENKEQIAAWGSELCIIQDPASSPVYGFYPVPVRDGKTFSLVNTAAEEGFTELLAWNITHDALPDSLYFGIDVNNEAEWEEPGAGSAVGKNQCAAAELAGKMVTVSYTVPDGLTAGEELDLAAALRERLDALDTPYAIGKDGLSGNLLVSLSPERTGVLLMELLGVKKTSLLFQRGGLYGILYSSDNPDFTYETCADGTLEAVMSWKELPENIGTLSAQENTGKLLLTLNDMPLLATEENGSADGASLRFVSLPYREDGAILQDAAWVLDFLKSVITGAKLPVELSLKSYQFETGEDGTVPTEDDFYETYKPVIEKTAETVCALDRRITYVVREEEGRLNLYLNLDVSENLPEQAVRLAKQIYEASGYEDSVLKELNLFLITEDDETSERARILFIKNPSSVNLTGTGRPYVNAYGAFKGGRLDAYRDAFKKLIEEDAFFREKTGIYTSWYYGEE